MKVSIAITTYNREKFIAQALESVLMQKVQFDYEIIIGDDCSTDGTQSILSAYQEKYPHRINTIFNAKNLGMNKNFASVFKACKGLYIALLDSDDIWTSPTKLQRQVDYLEEHPECSIIFHDSRHFYEDGSQDDWFVVLPVEKDVFFLEDLKNTFIPTTSTMIRRGDLRELPEWYSELKSLEWPLHVIAAQYGNIRYIDEVMSATRIHQEGEWNSLKRIEQIKTALYNREMVYKHVPLLREPLRNTLDELCLAWAAEAARLGKINESRMAIRKSSNYFNVSDFMCTISRVKLLVKVYTPGLNRFINYMRSK
jgi:glycosyltransferase involved in cell wall biosynthesis